MATVADKAADRNLLQFEGSCKQHIGDSSPGNEAIGSESGDRDGGSCHNTDVRSRLKLVGWLALQALN